MTVDTAVEKGWSQLTNGILIESAERDGYGALITTDQNLRYQQNLKDRKIAIVVLKTTSWPRIRNSVEKVVAALEKLSPRSFVEIDFP
jgi:hypothetical protein